MNEQNQTDPKVFQTIDGNSIITQQHGPMQFSIDTVHVYHFNPQFNRHVESSFFSLGFVALSAGTSAGK